MKIITPLGVGLGLSLFAAGPAAANITHTASLEHASGPVQAQYRGAVVIAHKQVGAVAPPGARTTLRCAWTARIAVDRVATTASGAVASRSFDTEGVAKGSRAGWCKTNRSAIAQEVAGRLRDADRHLARAAHQDRPVLLSEVDRIHDPA